MKRSPTVAVIALIGALLFNVYATNGLAQESNIDAEGSEDAPQVTGFRSALFGMTESQTLQAIDRDFEISKNEIAKQSNPEERTSSLEAVIADIFPGSDLAQIAYIHGYDTEKLIQINILWGLPVTDYVDPQTLVSPANVLRNYFVQLGFDPGSTVANTFVNDGLLIVFRAVDEQGRMVLLQLISQEITAVDEEGNEKPEESTIQPVSLLLSYIENPKNPDIFQIEKGKF